VVFDRRSIERRDFPRRLLGYDRAAVEAHLRALADDLEARFASTADATAEQVRGVLAAAQESAAAIVRDARADAELRRSVAGRVGEDAAARASVAASGALERIETLRGELTALLDALRAAPAEEPPDVEPPLAEHSPPVAELPVAEPTVPADEEGARLVALEMALSGAPRDEADHYLAEHYDIADRTALLDDVYAVAGAAS